MGAAQGLPAEDPALEPRALQPDSAPSGRRSPLQPVAAEDRSRSGAAPSRRRGLPAGEEEWLPFLRELLACDQWLLPLPALPLP